MVAKHVSINKQKMHKLLVFLNKINFSSIQLNALNAKKILLNKNSILYMIMTQTNAIYVELEKRIVIENNK